MARYTDVRQTSISAAVCSMIYQSFGDLYLAPYSGIVWKFEVRTFVVFIWSGSVLYDADPRSARLYA